MQTTGKSYTTQSVLAALGYADPMDAARQQARMILLGRLSRYEAAIQLLQNKWGKTLAEMRARYTVPGDEDFTADDDYMEWQWYSDALDTIKAQLEAIANN